jgi:amidase
MNESRSSEIVMMEATALSRAIKSRRLSCVEVMNAYLDHIERINPRVNAIVSLQPRDELIKQARYRDEQLARSEWLGPMHGFPQAIKDLENTAGVRTTMGSPLFKDFMPAADSIMVERMKRAGSIIIAKTNTPEFGLGSHTYNPIFGTTSNAYDQSKTAGGSSGGAAVSLALRMQAVADGSDHAGSLRNPAAFNNVFGFRTAFGRIPIELPDVFVGALGVKGPMARNVPDLAMLLFVQSGYDPRAPLSIKEDPARFIQPLEHDFKGVRIAYVGDFNGYLPFEPGVMELCKNALDVFEHLGCIVEEATPDFPIQSLWEKWLRLRALQVGAGLKALYDDPSKRALMKPEVCWEIESGLKLSAYDIAEAGVVRTAWYAAVRKFFEKYDYFALPSAQVFPFDASMRWPNEINGKPMDTYHRWMEVAVPVTMSGCPALNMPVGFNERGLPMGIQMVAPNHADWECLQLAHAYDLQTSWTRERLPPLLSEP